MPKSRQMKDIKIYQGKGEVQKNNHLIKCLNPLTAIQRKSFVWLLGETIEQIKLAGNMKESYSIEIRKYLNAMGVDGRNYEWLRNSIIDLLDKKLTWRTPKGGEIYTTLMSMFKLEDGVMEWRMDKFLQEKILAKGFTLLKLPIIMQFKSTYTIALYELLNQWKRRHWVEFDLKEFRKIMGIQKNEYDRIFDFKKKVINVAIEELNRTSDIIVFCTDKKQGRNIVGFRFHFYTMDKKQIKQRDQFYQDKKKYIDDLKKDTYIQKLIANKIEFKINDEWLAMTEKGLCRGKKVIISLEFFYGFIKSMKSIGSEIETRKGK